MRQRTRLGIKLAATGAALVALVPAAQAGMPGCGVGANVGLNDCGPGVVVNASAPRFDDMMVSIDQPMGHLRSVDYRRSPHVSITRIHGMGHTAALDDHPSAFTEGCHPESTTYCRAGSAAAPSPAPAAAPFVAAPVATTPVMAAPVVAAPVMAAPRAVPVQPQLRQWTASYNADPDRYRPRQHGSLDFVPGIAHVPTSWVDRDPGRAQAALNASGRGGIAPGPQTGLQRIPDATPGPLMPIGQLTGPTPIPPADLRFGATQLPRGASLPGAAQPSVQYSRGPVLGSAVATYAAPAVAAPVMSAPVMATAPVPVGMGNPFPEVAPRPDGLASAPVKVAPGTYGSSVGVDGTYWEKVSGTKFMGSTLVTDVICKRAVPTQTINPLVGVPVPVPYDACAPGVPHVAHEGHVSPAPLAAPHMTVGLAGGDGWIH